MFILKYSSRFKKDLKTYEHNEDVLIELEKILDILAKGLDSPSRNSNHRLSGEFKGCFECHIKPDIILVYRVDKEEVTILLLRIGSHSNIF